MMKYSGLFFFCFPLYSICWRTIVSVLFHSLARKLHYSFMISLFARFPRPRSLKSTLKVVFSYFHKKKKSSPNHLPDPILLGEECVY